MNPVTEFTVNGILSSGLDDGSKRHALERLKAMVNVALSNLHTETPKSNYDFSTLPGIDDICVKTIIPYLGNDGQALMNMFGKTTKRFLTVPTIRDIYNSNILSNFTIYFTI